MFFLQRWPSQRSMTRVRQRKGRNLRPGEAERWTHDFFHHEHGLHRLRGTVKYPEAA